MSHLLQLAAAAADTHRVMLFRALLLAVATALVPRRVSHWVRRGVYAGKLWRQLRRDGVRSLGAGGHRALRCATSTAAAGTDAREADDFYELVTELTGRSLILTANRAAADRYPLFPNPVLARSILDRLVNFADHVHMDRAATAPTAAPAATI